ncbi:unnamed protein product [Camellia sinensis]
MSSTSLMFFLLALWFLFFSDICCAQTQGVVYGGGGIYAPNPCSNCSICQYPCHPQPPRPPSGGYQSYDAPPPLSSPPPEATVLGNCTPVPVVQCCQFPPSVPYSTLPYNSDSVSLIKPLGTVWCSVIFFFLFFVFVFHV